MNTDYLKEKIAYYKFWLTFFITADASLIAWGYNHFKIWLPSDFIIINFTIFLLTLVILVINKKSKIFLEKLEDINGN